MHFHSVPGTMGILDRNWGLNKYNTNGNSIGIMSDPSPYIVKNSTSSVEQNHLFGGGEQNIETHPEAKY